MASLVKTLSSVFHTDSTPETVSLRVPTTALKASLDTGLYKRPLLLNRLPISRYTRVKVEAATAATSDSVFFVPEAASADESQQRVTPTQFIKINPDAHDDVVRSGDQFELAFLGMSVTPHDMFGDNDLLLCSFSRDQLSPLHMLPTELIHSTAPSSATDSDTQERQMSDEKNFQKCSSLQYPAPLRMHPRDIPFIHYDPMVDGHDVGSRPDTFVPIPGSKRIYKQKSRNNDASAMFVRFSVMEIDKLSDEHLSAINSIQTIANSVKSASATVPYLKIVSWLLKFGNKLGQSALRKVSTPDHVMSQDISFKIAAREPGQQSQLDTFGDYLRYGDYYFLSKKVDAKLYVQTGSSSQTAPLLLRRSGYRPATALQNEKEYFALTGVSYVAMKVSRGCSPLLGDRRETALLHRDRLQKLFAKYTIPEPERPVNG